MMNDLTDRELKELKDKAEAWDIVWPALIFLDATGQLDGPISWNLTLKRAVKQYNSSRTDESV